MLASVWKDWLDPLQGNPYQFWSGIGADFGLATILAVWWRHHNCHVRGCWRLEWHEHPGHHHPVCRKHFPGDPPDA